MSEPKRANLITVDSAKVEKKKVNKTIRLDIDLFHSNEKEYPAFNYKELVRFEEGKSNGVSQSENPSKNGPQSLDPFSDNDEDVERIAKQFEQKYGSASTYGKTKGRSKEDDYADIGAGYDENDSFIDNTDGYDEMIPPEADTAYGGFYINCGALEFTSVPYQPDENEDPNPIRRNNKRAISSSTSGDESSESSGSESDTTEEPEKCTDVDKKSSDVPNGIVQHKSSEQRKTSKSEKRHEKKRHKRMRRDGPDTSGKDARNKMDVDDVHPVTDGGSADQEMSTDSRTSDSVVSKPAPSSDNAATSESSREAPAHSGSEEGGSASGGVETALPVEVSACVESIRTLAAETRVRNHGVCTLPQMQPRLDHLIKQLDNLLRSCRVGVRRSAWGAAARAVGQGRARLQKQARLLRVEDTASTTAPATATTSMPASSAGVPASSTATGAPTSAPSTAGVSGGLMEHETGSVQNTEAIMLRLKTIIKVMRPSLILNYNQECQRVQDANKKIAAQNAVMEDDMRIPEKRLPKRTFPWNEEVRLLLSELVRSCGSSWSEGAGGAGSREEAAAVFLRDSVLPLFPQGFVRMPTLLQQASLSKDQKIPNTDTSKRYKPDKIYASAVTKPGNTNNEVENVTPQHLPTTAVAHDKHKNDKTDAPLNSILSSLNLPATTNVTIEKTSKQPSFKEDKTEITLEDKKSDNKYTPPNSIGSITITPVVNTQRFDTKTSKVVNSVTITASPPKGNDIVEIKGIRVKSPSELMKPTNITTVRDDKGKHTLVTPTVTSRDDSVRKDKQHTSKHKSSHDKVKHGHRTKSPNLESQISKEIRKPVENTNVSKSDSTRKVDGQDFVKKKISAPTRSVSETLPKRPDNGIKSNKTEPKEMTKPHTNDSVTHNTNDNFVKPTDKKRPDSNSKNQKTPDDSVKIMSDVIMDVSDSSSDVELIEDVLPSNNVPSSKSNTKNDEKSQKADVSKKFTETIHKDSESSEKNMDSLVKQNKVSSKMDPLVKQNSSLCKTDPLARESSLSSRTETSVKQSTISSKEDTLLKQNTLSSKAHTFVKQNTQSSKTDTSVKQNTLSSKTDTSVKQNSTSSQSVSVSKTSRKDTDCFVEPITKRSKTESDTTVTMVSDSDLVKSYSDRTKETSANVRGNHVDVKVSEKNRKEDDMADINHYDINKVMQDLKELQKSQEVPEMADDMFYSRPDKKNHQSFSTPHLDMFQDSSSAENKSDSKSMENSNHSITSG